MKVSAASLTGRDKLWPFTPTETVFLTVLVVAFGCFVLGFWCGADAVKAVR